MILNNDSKYLINLILDNGYKAYAVGGCVRDALMGVDYKDIDITTSAKPNELEQILESNGVRFIETGIKHGTVTAILNNIPYEITTFRKDGEYTDSRHPNNVEFVDELFEDLSRRDFTMNAIAYNDIEGFVEYHDGKSDIENKIIRCVGEPNKRFKEDALRIIRALRFASALGFTIEDETKKAIFNNKELLKNIAVERVFVELNKLLNGDNVEQILHEYKDVFAVIIPDIIDTFCFHQNIKWHLFDVYTHTCKAVAYSPKNDVVRFAALFHDIGKPKCCTTDARGVDHFFGHQHESAEIAKKILRNFKVSNDFYNRVIILIAYHDEDLPSNAYEIKYWFRLIGVQNFFDLMDLKIADLKAHNIELTQSSIDLVFNIKNEARRILNSNEPYLISHLCVNGNDLQKLGYYGKDIAVELNNLVRVVSNNPNFNQKELLLEQAKKDLGN